MSHELTADEILSADDLAIERVEVPEWGGHVYVRGLSGTDRDKFESSMIERRQRGRGTQSELKLDNVRAGLVARCIVSSQTKQRIFTDSQIETLGRKSAAALDKVYEVASRLSGLRPEDVDELVQDFTEGQSEPSTSA